MTLPARNAHANGTASGGPEHWTARARLRGHDGAARTGARTDAANRRALMKATTPPESWVRGAARGGLSHGTKI